MLFDVSGALLGRMKGSFKLLLQIFGAIHSFALSEGLYKSKEKARQAVCHRQIIAGYKVKLVIRSKK
jgi:hypothetical protein